MKCKNCGAERHGGLTPLCLECGEHQMDLTTQSDSDAVRRRSSSACSLEIGKMDWILERVKEVRENEVYATDLDMEMFAKVIIRDLYKHGNYDSLKELTTICLGMERRFRDRENASGLPPAEGERGSK